MPCLDRTWTRVAQTRRCTLAGPCKQITGNLRTCICHVFRFRTCRATQPMQCLHSGTNGLSSATQADHTCSSPIIVVHNHNGLFIETSQQHQHQTTICLCHAQIHGVTDWVTRTGKHCTNRHRLSLTNKCRNQERLRDAGSSFAKVGTSSRRTMQWTCATILRL